MKLRSPRGFDRAFEELFYLPKRWAVICENSGYDVFAEAYHLKVTPRTDACTFGAAGQQPLIEPKPARSGSASTLKQVNNQDDDSNYEQ